MMWGRDDWSWWSWLLMTGGMIAFSALVAWVVVSIVRDRRGPQEPRQPDAQAILAERFARGEIDEREYRERLETLRTPGPYVSSSRPDDTSRVGKAQ
jgi:putative membrane protein